MKRIIYIILAATAAFTACKKDESAKINDVTIQVVIGNEPVTDAVEVTVTDKSSSTAYKATTVNGTATFQLVAGIYEASATVYKESSIFNGTNPAVTVVDNGTNSFRLELSESTTSQVIIKELYFAGCMDNEDAKDYALDKYVILYNNSPVEADASKFAFAIGNPANANATNNYLKDGKLTYSDYIPAWTACWWFDTNVRIAPYSQIVISITGAINHTETYRNSVDLRSSTMSATIRLLQRPSLQATISRLTATEWATHGPSPRHLRPSSSSLRKEPAPRISSRILKT